MDLTMYDRAFAQMAAEAAPWTAEVDSTGRSCHVVFKSAGSDVRSICISGDHSSLNLSAEGIYGTMQIIEGFDESEVHVVLNRYRLAVDAYLGSPTEHGRSRWGNTYIVIRLPDGDTVHLKQTLAREIGNVLKRRSR